MRKNTIAFKGGYWSLSKSEHEHIGMPYGWGTEVVCAFWRTPKAASPYNLVSMPGEVKYPMQV